MLQPIPPAAAGPFRTRPAAAVRLVSNCTGADRGTYQSMSTQTQGDQLYEVKTF